MIQVKIKTKITTRDCWVIGNLFPFLPSLDTWVQTTNVYQSGFSYLMGGFQTHAFTDMLSHAG